MTDEVDLTALRDQIAASRGVSPEDRDVLMTGANEETLTLQADWLAANPPAPETRQNVAPREGHIPSAPSGPQDMAEYTKALFDSANDLDY